MKPKNIIYAFVLLVLPLFIAAQSGIVNKGMKIIVEENYAIILGSDMNLTNQNNGTILLDGMIQVESDVINNSSTSNMFINTNNMGTLVLNGASEQTLGGSGKIALDNLEVSSAGVNLETDIEQNGMLIFNSGRVNLHDNHYLFNTTGSISGTYSVNNMFVSSGIGEVRKSFSSAGTFTFPVGEETEIREYSPAVINIASVSGNSGSYVGLTVTDQKYFANSSTSEYLSRFWRFSGNEINSINYSATFYYTDDDIVGSESAIYATAFTESARIPYSTVNATNNSFSVSNQTEFAAFTGTDGSTGILDLIEHKLLVYPNPASSYIDLELPDFLVGNIKVDLINQQGSVMKDELLKELDYSAQRQARISVGEISPGLYYLRFITRDGIIQKKIVLE